MIHGYDNDATSLTADQIEHQKVMEENEEEEKDEEGEENGDEEVS